MTKGRPLRAGLFQFRAACEHTNLYTSAPLSSQPVATDWGFQLHSRRAVFLRTYYFFGLSTAPFSARNRFIKRRTSRDALVSNSSHKDTNASRSSASTRMISWLSFLFFCFSFLPAMNAATKRIYNVYTLFQRRQPENELSALLAADRKHHQIKIMTFWQFLIFLLLSVFVLWNIWFAIRSLGDLNEKD